MRRRRWRRSRIKRCGRSKAWPRSATATSGRCLCTTDVRLAEPPRRIGTTGQHLSLRLEQHGVAMRAVAFGGGDWEEDLNGASGPLAVAFKPVINNFRGRQTVEMQLADWRSDAAH